MIKKGLYRYKLKDVNISPKKLLMYLHQKKENFSSLNFCKFIKLLDNSKKNAAFFFRCNISDISIQSVQLLKGRTLKKIVYNAKGSSNLLRKTRSELIITLLRNK